MIITYEHMNKIDYQVREREIVWERERLYGQKIKLYIYYTVIYSHTILYIVIRLAKVQKMPQNQPTIWNHTNEIYTVYKGYYVTTFCPVCDNIKAW